MPFTLPKKSPDERGAKFREETAHNLWARHGKSNGDHSQLLALLSTVHLRLNLSGRLSWRCFYAPAIQRRCAAITRPQNLRLSTAPGGSLRSVVISEPSSLPNRGINHAEMSRLQSCVWSDSSPMVGLPVLWKELSPRLSCKTSAADRTRERVAYCTRWPEW